MKKYILGALCLVAGLFSAQAEKPTYYPCLLVVNTVDGQTINYKFADKPVATFENEDLVLTLESTERVTYPMEQIAKLTFASDTDGIESVTTPGSSLDVTVTSTFIAIQGLNPGEEVRLFDLNGRLIAAAQSDADGAVEIAVEGLEKGVYVVATPRHSFKFIK